MSNLKTSTVKQIIAVQTAQAPRRQTRGGAVPETDNQTAASQETPGFAVTQLYASDPQQRIDVIRQGIPAASVAQLSTRMGVSKEYLINSLRLSRATINRKERDGTALSSDESERVLGVETLIGMAQTMVAQSGNPDGFDAPRWVSAWLAQALPALGGATPASYMDTFEGQKLVAELLAMSQSGAYA